MIAHLLVTEGFTTVEAVAFVPLEELSEIEGFDSELAEELRNRATTFIAERDERLEEERKKLGVSDEIAGISGLEPKMLVQLGKEKIKSLNDLADLSSDELKEILGNNEMSLEDANKVIMAARAHWFEKES